MNPEILIYILALLGGFILGMLYNDRKTLKINWDEIIDYLEWDRD